MSVIGKTLAELGVISPSAIQQFQRWKNPGVENIDSEKIPETPASLEEVAARTRQVLTSRENVEVRETDLDIFSRFSATRSPVILHIQDETMETDVEIDVGRTPLGDFIIPWSSDGIEDLMTNGMTCLVMGGRLVFFTDVRDLYADSDKVFMVCTPRVEDAG